MYARNGAVSICDKTWNNLHQQIQQDILAIFNMSSKNWFFEPLALKPNELPALSIYLIICFPIGSLLEITPGELLPRKLAIHFLLHNLTNSVKLPCASLCATQFKRGKGIHQSYLCKTLFTSCFYHGDLYCASKTKMVFFALICLFDHMVIS